MKTPFNERDFFGKWRFVTQSEEEYQISVKKALLDTMRKQLFNLRLTRKSKLERARLRKKILKVRVELMALTLAR